MRNPVAQLVGRVRKQKLDALEELDMLVLTVERAVDFCTVGGAVPLLRLLELPGMAQEPEVAGAAAQVVGSLTANNPKVQEKIQGLGGVALLLAALSFVIGQRPPHDSFPRVRGEAGDPAPQPAQGTETDGEFRPEWSRMLEQMSEVQRLGLASKLLLGLGSLVRNSAAGHDLLLQPGGRGIALVLDVVDWASRRMEALEAAGDGPGPALRQARNVLQKGLRLLQFFSDREVVAEAGILTLGALVAHRSAGAALLRVAQSSRDRHLRECLWQTLHQVVVLWEHPLVVTSVPANAVSPAERIVTARDFFGEALAKEMRRHHTQAREALGRLTGGAGGRSRNQRKKDKQRQRRRKQAQQAAMALQQPEPEEEKQHPQQPPGDGEHREVAEAVQSEGSADEDGEADNDVGEAEAELLRGEMAGIEELARVLGMQLLAAAP